VGETPETVASLRGTPFWAPLAALTPTWTRELREIDDLGPGLDRYQPLTMPTLLLRGTESSEHPLSEHPLKEASAALAATLADVRNAYLPGQGHTANALAPAQFADAVGHLLSS